MGLRRLAHSEVWQSLWQQRLLQGDDSYFLCTAYGLCKRAHIGGCGSSSIFGILSPAIRWSLHLLGCLVFLKKIFEHQIGVYAL